MEIIDSKDASAVQAHINMLQGIINRMAQNSANCKVWAITLVSALLALRVDEGARQSLLYYLPIVGLFWLDCYYLGLERRIIGQQRNFVKRLNNKENVADRIFRVESGVECGILKVLCQLWDMLKAALSISTLPFYLIISIIVYSVLSE